MLLKTGVNLSSRLSEFIKDSHSLTIFVPYVKLNTLENLLSDSVNNCKLIVVRWEPRDLILGASDLEVYNFCRDNKIALYRNPRVHLKAFIDDYNTCIMGSANISKRALNLPEYAQYNYELAIQVPELNLEDKMYFQKILSSSVLITDAIYEQIENQLSEKKKIFPEESEFNLLITEQEKDFLISSLPMSYSVDDLIEVYYNPASFGSLEQNCLVHDLVLYSIPFGLEKNELKERLAITFFTHPFIKSFLHELENHREMYFGRVKEWIQQHCADVPTPRKWEITENIQILYRWIIALGNGKYKADRPGYSERIFIKS